MATTKDYDLEVRKIFRLFLDKKISYQEMWDRYWQLLEEERRDLEYKYIFGDATWLQ